MKDMTKGNPLKLILVFAFPIMLGNLLQQFYNLADAAIVGRFLGPKALAAVGATSSVQFLILGFCLGTTSGFCVPIAARFGAKDYSEMRRLFFNSILLTGVIALVATSLCVGFRSTILRVLSTPADIWEDTNAYILVIYLGIPFSLIYNLTAGVLRAVGDSKTPFVVLAISTVSNIFLDIFCIAVLHWGCAGAAIATISAQALSGFLCTAVIIRKYRDLHILPEERRADGALAKHLLLVGVPMGMQFSITAVGSIVLQSATNGLGSLYASASTASMRIKMLGISPLDAVASGVATFCSQNYGARDYSRIRDGVKFGTLIALVYSLVMGIGLIFFGRTACLVFMSSNETEILDAAEMYLKNGGIFFWVLGLLNVVRIVVQGLGRSGRAVFSGVMEMIARIGVVMLFVPTYGFAAICLADPAAWAAADLYIIPTCLFVMRSVERELCGEAETRVISRRKRRSLHVA